MRIGSNIPAAAAARNYETHQQKAAVSIGRLSSGKRINSAADDPAGMAISQKFKANIRELNVRIRDTETARDKADADSDILLVRQDMLSRLREIAVQVENDTLTQEDKDILMKEYSELVKEFADFTEQSTGMEIVVGNTGDTEGQLMYKRGDKVYANGQWTAISELFPAEDDSDGENGLSITAEEAPQETADTLSSANATSAAGTKKQSSPTTSLIDYVDSLIKRNLSSMSAFGAESSGLTKRLEALLANEEDATAALSRIEDADIAKEMLEYVKENILSQCALLAAAQANVMPERVLELLDVS